MKTMIKSSFMLLLSSIHMFGQTNDLPTKLGQPCDPEFIFDYRMLYGDTITPINEFIESEMTDRYNLDVDYFLGELDTPEELIISLMHPDYPELIIWGKLCNVEKIYQEGDLIKTLENYFRSHDEP